MNASYYGTADLDEALVEGAALLDPGDELIGDGLAGLVLPRIDLENLGRHGPVLHDLARKLTGIGHITPISIGLMSLDLWFIL